MARLWPQAGVASLIAVVSLSNHDARPSSGSGRAVRITPGPSNSGEVRSVRVLGRIRDAGFDERVVTLAAFAARPAVQDCGLPTRRLRPGHEGSCTTASDRTGRRARRPLRMTSALLVPAYGASIRSVMREAERQRACHRRTGTPASRPGNGLCSSVPRTIRSMPQAAQIHASLAEQDDVAARQIHVFVRRVIRRRLPSTAQCVAA